MAWDLTPLPPSPRGKGETSELILVRHGETNWNLEGRYQGGVDIPLNGTGRAQAATLSGQLAGWKIDALYCSPLGRALDTARAVAPELELEPHPDPRLQEIDLGEWEGMLVSRITDLYPELHRRWMEDPRSVRPPGGESIRQVHDRVVAAVEEILHRHPGGSLCLVCHKVVIAVLRTHYLGQDLPTEMGRRAPNGGWERLVVVPRPPGEACCSAVVAGRPAEEGSG